MKLSNSFILLSSALLMQVAGAAENATTTTCADLEAAEANCTATHSCTKVIDIELDDNCGDIKEEHCEKIEVCLECKEEIHAMFACNYGAKCGESLDAACLEEAVENVDDHNENTHNSLNSDDVKAASTPSSAATRGVVAALALAAGSMIIA
mmetsp:Transcript_3063/g.4644  ORF Transcript_3063/g.4644 Transcript_3063/m.4644 type:complete len:152 (+) Transcript_3063:112-567(+)